MRWVTAGNKTSISWGERWRQLDAILFFSWDFGAE